MARKEDLEKGIRDSYEIIRQYEEIIRTSDLPDEKARARRVIGEQWEHVRGYLDEYRRLVGDVLPEGMAQLAARFSALAELSKVEQIIETQESSRGILPDDQLDALLVPWREKQTAIYAQLWGDGIIAQKGSAVNTGDGVTIGGDAGGPVVIARENVQVTVTIGETPVEIPASDHISALSHYLRHVIEANRRLQLQGIRSAGKLVSIGLEQVYITLTATERRTVSEEEAWVDEMARLAPGETKRLAQRGIEQQRESVIQVKVKVQEALARHRRLVVLGDPGCGKTTLLRYLALTYARDMAGAPGAGKGTVQERLQLDECCLPILLPLRNLSHHLEENHPDASLDGPDYCSTIYALVLATRTSSFPGASLPNACKWAAVWSCLTAWTR